MSMFISKKYSGNSKLYMEFLLTKETINKEGQAEKVKATECIYTQNRVFDYKENKFNDNIKKYAN